MTTPWPVDANGQPVPADANGAPDLRAVSWPVVDGRWAPIGPDGRPVVRPGPQRVRVRRGELRVDEHFLTIAHKRLAMTGMSEVRVPLAQITGVDYRPGSILIRGHFRAIIAGGATASVTARNTIDRANDPYWVTFGPGANAGVEAVRRAIEDVQRRRHT